MDTRSFIAMGFNGGSIRSPVITGFEKVEKASEIYDLFFNNKDFDPNNYFINKTL